MHFHNHVPRHGIHIYIHTNTHTHTYRRVLDWLADDKTGTHASGKDDSMSAVVTHTHTHTHTYRRVLDWLAADKTGIHASGKDDSMSAVGALVPLPRDYDDVPKAKGTYTAYGVGFW